MRHGPASILFIIPALKCPITSQCGTQHPHLRSIIDSSLFPWSRAFPGRFPGDVQRAGELVNHPSISRWDPAASFDSSLNMPV